MEKNTPQAHDAIGECLLYHEYVTCVFIADAKIEERAALRLMLLDLKMEIAGEASDWSTTLVQVPLNQKVTRPSVWQSVYAPLPRVFALDDAARLNAKIFESGASGLHHFHKQETQGSKHGQK